MTNNDNEIKRRRFHKAFGLTSSLKKHPWRSLSEVFKLFQLDDIRSEMKGLLHAGLINDQSAYEEGTAREDLMEFSDQLLKLSEVMYILHRNHQEKKSSSEQHALSEQAIESIKLGNKIMSLDEDEKSNPVNVIHYFCTTFSKRYCVTEIWDLLDAAVTCRQNMQQYKGNLTLFCQSMLCLCQVAFFFDKRNTIK